MAPAGCLTACFCNTICKSIDSRGRPSYVARAMLIRRSALLCCAVLLAAAPTLGGEYQAPELVKTTEVKRPAAGGSPAQDHVLVEFTVTATGQVQDVAVLESAGEAWDQAVRESMASWEFRAARHEGVPAPARMRLSLKLLAPGVDAGASPVAEDAGAPDAGAPLDTVAPPNEPPAIDAGAALVEVLDAGHPSHELSTTVSARSPPKSRGASDVTVDVGALKAVPRASGGDFLKLAPGILLTNEGGEGHPERIFLRGFDAKEGQDLELTVDGVPVNDSGNLHGNGYADLNFIIPELVESLRVIEGPFDPRQGNYAVAGSADYQLGLGQRGLTMKGAFGSFNTGRLTLLWGPESTSSRTFGGVQLSRSDGFGQSRASQSARAAAQYEGRLSDSLTWRVAAIGYASAFRSAGVIREDDLRAGRVGFYDTYDARQGGEAARFSFSTELHYHQGGFTAHQELAVVGRSSRMRENFTGFLTDVQLPRQSAHPQRGDLLDRATDAWTLVGRGYGRLRGQLLGRTQELELGYFARYDTTAGQQQRLLAGADTFVPYAKDLDLEAKLTDVGLYADANVNLTGWLALRGGVRADVLTYVVQNDCAATDVRRPSTTNPPGDASCLSQRDFGLYREPTERASAFGAAVMPRGTLLVGPFNGLTFTASLGDGVRSMDPQFVNQGRETPFAAIRAWEGGALWGGKLAGEKLDLSARAVVFGTRVDKDLIFSEQEGRNVLGGATNRLGGLVQARLRGPAFDVAAHGTYVQSRFEDTGFLVPYVPDLVLRFDGALFGDLPWRPLGAPVKATGGLGITYVGQRALPFGQRSDVIFVMDASAEVSWRWVTVGVTAQNLLNTQYRLAEFNFASDFRTTPPFPTLVPVRHFTAGAPLTVLATLGVTLGGGR